MSFKKISVFALVVGGGFLLSCSGNISDSTVTIATTVRVSLNSSEEEGIGPCYPEIPAISSDGRFVAFASDATNLVPGDTNGYTDVFVRDLLLGTTEMVSVPSSNASVPSTLVQGPSRNPSISADGRFVAFQSDNNNLALETDDNGVTDVFLHDRNKGLTHLISIDLSSSKSGDALSINPSVSSDGNRVAFQSQADLLSGSVNNFIQIYVRDVSGSSTLLVSRDSGEFGSLGDDSSTNPSISGDGAIVAFETFAKNLDGSAIGGPDDDSQSDIYSRELSAPFLTVLVSRDDTGANGPKGNNSSYAPSVSEDGTVIAFQSNATNLITGLVDGGSSDVFVRVGNSSTYIISVHTSGAQGEGSCILPSISGDGNRVVFESDGASLVNGDNNLSRDIFLHDRVRGVTSRVSVATYGSESLSDSQFPVISQDGQFVVFFSLANNLAGDDDNGAGDVFRRGPVY